MPRKPDLSIIGQTYNNLHVNRITDECNSYNRRLYECTCLLCGKKRMASKANLLRGEIKDCGNHRAYKDLAGQKFGMLTVLYITDKKYGSSNRHKIWHCVCECGKECDVSSGDLLSGNTQSCGCLVGKKAKELYVEGTAPCKLNPKNIRQTNTSGVTGVWYDKTRQIWCAEIMFKKKKYFLGRYKDKADAIAIRKQAEDKIFGEFLEWYQRQYPEQWEKMQNRKTERENENEESES